MFYMNDFILELRRINAAVLAIRENTPVTMGSWQKPADLFVKEEVFHGKKVNAVNITLTPTGCEWAKHGGCTMCGEWSGSTLGKKIDAKFHIAQFANAVIDAVPKYRSPWVRIYQEGSYMNPNEVGASAQKVILRLASMIKDVQKITVEGMAKYINEDAAKLIKSSVARGVELEVGMGFEAQDDVIRMVCVNKGEPISFFQRAISILKKYEIKTLAYVLLKPAFLGEKEAIDEAVRTIQKAFDLGFDAVSLEPVSIHEWCLVEALNKNNIYDTPWLWSIVDVVKRCGYVPDLRIGGVEYYPRPGIVVHNRHPGGDGCNAQFWETIKEYNTTQNREVFDSLQCDCKKRWEKELSQKYQPLKERINSYMDAVSIPDYIREKKLEKGKRKIWSGRKKL
jgi:radical SAM enzyme (TIGR01210 family)